MNESNLLNNCTDILSHLVAGIYWNSYNFDIGKKFLGKNSKILRAKKSILLGEYLFDWFENFSCDLYIVPSFYWENGIVKWSQSIWFSDWKFSKSNVFYREIISEANRCKVNLRETHFLNYKKYGKLAQKLCRGNMEQISDVSFSCPKMNFAIRPTYDIQLMLYGNNTKKIEGYIKSLLNYSSELGYYYINTNCFAKK